MAIDNNHSEYILKKISKKEADFIDLFGVSVALLYSKDVFKKNQDISEFLKSVFNIDFLPYVMRSRTLIAARITKELNSKDDGEIKQIKEKFIDYLKKGYETPETKKITKKKDANEKMKTWLEGL